MQQVNDMGIPDGFRSHRWFGIHFVIWHNNSPGIYLYFMHYSEDGLTTKVLVSAIWILDTLHLSFVCHILYYYLITNYGVPTSLNYIVWSLPASVLVNVLVVSMVQCFFAHQIYHLCRSGVKWLVTGPIILFVLAQFGFGMETVILEYSDLFIRVHRNADLRA
ncbi:hypothetical protein EDD16DRAFT_107268 [Pisolithus croceorrhizus]|nr:hypothetical protein EDD16DRAFT_107268 [Pisolithus croceorrhizus]